MSWYEPWTWGTSVDNSGLPGSETDPVNNPTAMSLDTALGTPGELVTMPDGSQQVKMGKAGSIATADKILGNGGASLTGQVSAQILYQQALEQAAAAHGIAAPTAVNPQTVVAAQLNPNAYAAYTNTNAQAENAALQTKAYQASLAQASNAAINNVKEANVTKVAAVPGADVARVNTNITAPTIGEAAQTGAINVDRTKLDPLANQLRDSEIKAAQDISAGPSAAMAQFQAGQSQVVADQLAAAAAARGAERAGARREAMINIGAKGAQNNLAASSLAAQEDQAKRVAAASALSNIRTQDVTSATNAASITAQQQNLQAQLDSAIAQGNTAAINSIKQQQAQLSLQAGTASVQAGLAQQGTLADVAKYNTSLQEQKALADAAAANKAASDYASSSNAAYGQFAQSQTAAGLQNAGNQTLASKDYASTINAANQAYAAAATNVNLQNAALAQQQAQANANRALTADTTNVTGATSVSAANAGNSLEAQKTNAANQLNTQTLRNNALSNANSTALGAANTQATIGAADKGVGIAQSAQQTQKESALIGAAASVGAAAVSDERAKEDIQKLSPYETRHWAESIDPITFRYKDGFEDGGRDAHLGVSAQQVERSGPMGRIMVHEDPETNVKRVDYGALTLMLSKTALDVANEALERAKGKRARRAV